MSIRKHLTAPEFQALRAWLRRRSDPKNIIIELIALTGMRQCEALALTGNALDVGAQALKVKSGKGSHSRLVPLDSKTMERMKPFFKDLLAREARAGDLITDGGSLNPAFQARYLRRHWFLISKEIFGDYIVSLHGLRHSFVGRVFTETKNDLLAAQELIGHVNANSTVNYLRYYKTLDRRADVLRANETKDDEENS